MKTSNQENSLSIETIKTKQESETTLKHRAKWTRSSPSGLKKQKYIESKLFDLSEACTILNSNITNTILTMSPTGYLLAEEASLHLKDKGLELKYTLELLIKEIKKYQ